MENQVYATIQTECLQDGRLWEDPIFPAADSSLFFSKSVSDHIGWKRPPEIVEEGEPMFIVDGATRHDLDQGSLGNCWFVAAAATVATKRKLLKKVVPMDQSFQKNYAGIFRFHLWRYGAWQDVVVDDRLPVKFGRYLLFCHNREQPNEFWAALLEKAYAKLHGSYEALAGGKIQDALVDMTGGASEVLVPRDMPRRELYVTLRQLQKANTLMGCSIATPVPPSLAARLSSGLRTGHAYSITGLEQVTARGAKHRLVRLRDPWGGVGDSEWTGAWADGSAEWNDVAVADRERIQMEERVDGEFWMDFTEWRRCFTELQLCHLAADSPRISKRQSPWECEAVHGVWVRGVSAGGCGLPPLLSLYWSNPQYHFQVVGPEADPGVEPGTEDEDDEGGQFSTVIISLMQVGRRKLKTEVKQHVSNISIGYDLYKLHDDNPDPLDAVSFAARAHVEQRNILLYSKYRENCRRYNLHPGNYCVVPATFDANCDARFYLRVLTGEHTHAALREMDIPTGPITGIDSDLREVFDSVCAEDGTVNAPTLQLAFTSIYTEDPCMAMDVSVYRPLIRMLDSTNTGKLDWEQFLQLKSRCDKWRIAFQESDDGSGLITWVQLKHVFYKMGVKLTSSLWEVIANAFGGDLHQFNFADTVSTAARVITLLVSYQELTNSEQIDSPNMEQWVAKTLIL